MFQKLRDNFWVIAANTPFAPIGLYETFLEQCVYVRSEANHKKVWYLHYYYTEKQLSTDINSAIYNNENAFGQIYLKTINDMNKYNYVEYNTECKDHAVSCEKFVVLNITHGKKNRRQSKYHSLFSV